ncbi:MAG: hypothetical protein K5988_03255 [Lachnospiraceae bacterium]|nr:hypothetical protein [Lachnospiraceae bacterium]
MKNTQNSDLKEILKKKNICIWEVAHEMGVAESTLLRWLRYTLEEDKRHAFLEAVDRIERR